MANMRDYFREKAKEIVDICEAGHYDYNGIDISLNIGGTEYYTPDYVLDIPSKEADLSKMNIEVADRDVTSAILLEAHKHSDSKIGVLNFASAHHPGGGFLNGAMAQEEAICQASTLYVQIRNNQMYVDNESCKTGVYNDGMLVTNTQFIRNSNFELLPNPVDVVMVTSPAVNTRRIFDDTNVEPIMYTRMEKIIKQFISHKCKTIILGAFGCGVFGNSPEMIAEIWGELLIKYGGYFDKVVFAIICGKNKTNYLAFVDCFRK